MRRTVAPEFVEVDRIGQAANGVLLTGIRRLMRGFVNPESFAENWSISGMNGRAETHLIRVQTGEKLLLRAPDLHPFLAGGQGDFSVAAEFIDLLLLSSD